MTHELDAEEGVFTPDGFVLRASCLCEFPFIVAAPDLRRAQNRLWWRVEEHMGFAAAAGLGAWG